MSETDLPARRPRATNSRRRLKELAEGGRRRLRRESAIEPVMLVLAGATGLMTGVFVWALISLIDLVQLVVWSVPVPAWQVVAIPTAGGLIVGLLVARIVPEARSGGVVATLESMAIRGGRLPKRVPFAGTLATGIALGTGASGGREGPIVLIGGSVGSLIARAVPLDEERTRLLVAAGAAAGIGATFNAPIGGMLFAIELLLGGIRRTGSLQVVVIASVVSAVTARQLVGEGLPIFRARFGLALGDPIELVLYAGLGLAAVAVAVGFRRGEDLARALFDRIGRTVGFPLRVAIGGLGVGLIALVIPEVLGEGSELPAIAGRREPIQAMLDGGFGAGWGAAGLLLVLLVAKLVATMLSVGSGSAVGTFAPNLFTGAALGGAFGIVAIQLVGEGAADPGAFALVGMAAVFTATVRAPLTAILIVFELTGTYDLVLPLMIAVGIATFSTELLGWESIYIRQLRRRGVVWGQREDLDVLQTVKVGEVMTSSPRLIPQDMDVRTLMTEFTPSGTHGFAVVDDRNRLVGVVTVNDLQRPGDTAGDICTKRVLTVTPDDALFRAVRRMASLDVGRIPVLDPVTREVVGILRRADIVRGYQRGISRSLGVQQRASTGRLRDLAGVGFVEVVVDRGSPMAAQAVRDIAWPERSVLTSIRRGGEVLVPTGTTVVEPGDELVVLTADGDAIQRLATADPG